MSASMPPRQPSHSRKGDSPKATPVVVALAVAACIAAIVAIALSVGGADDSTGSPARTGATTGSPSSAAPTSSPTSSPTGSLDCSEPPPPPAEPMTFDQAPDPSLAGGATWTASVSTNCGDITMELYGDRAPQTVASFITLAQEGYFDDSPCHRLTTAGIFVLQCGDPTGTGSGSPGYGFGIENAPADGAYPRGSLAMARTSDPNSNGSQFFIVYKDSTIADPTGYSIFGKVTQGLRIVDSLAEQGVTGGGGAGDGAPAQPISILGVAVAKA